MSTSYDSIKIYKFLLNHIHKLHTFYLMVFTQILLINKKPELYLQMASKGFSTGIKLW